MTENESAKTEKVKKGKKPAMSYEPRERLDGELERAIGEILSAEDEAKSILNRAEASVKSVQLDATTSERRAREHAATRAAAYKAAEVKAAAEAADDEVSRMLENAEKEGKALLEKKRAAIEKRACELFDGLRGV